MFMSSDTGGHTTKHNTPSRRHKGKSRPQILFTSNMISTLPKDKVLFNNTNKHKCINQLCAELEHTCKYPVFRDHSDAGVNRPDYHSTDIKP